MIFAKYINKSTITRCLRKGKSMTDGKVHTNLPRFYDENPDIAELDGYLPLIEMPFPEVQEGDYPSSVYVVENNTIVQTWEMIPIPEEGQN